MNVAGAAAGAAADNEVDRDALPLVSLSAKVDALSLKFDGFDEKIGQIASDQEIRRQNEQYLCDLRAGDAKRNALQTELSLAKTEVIQRGSSLLEATSKIAALEREVGDCKAKLAKSHALGEQGERGLLERIKELQALFGEGFSYRYTGKVKHSGDVIVDVRVRKTVAGGRTVFSILLDRKNYDDDCTPNNVQSAHIQKGVLDANRNCCDAVVVVYNTIADKHGDICEYEDISSRFSAPMDPTFVKACSLKALPVVFAKLMFDFAPIDVEQLNGLNVKESLKYAEIAYLNLFNIVGPVLGAIDIAKITKAASDASDAIIEAKRYLSVLPSKHGAELLSLLSRFPEKSNGNRGGKAIQVTGSKVKLNEEADELRKRELTDGEASSSKCVKMIESACG